MNKENIKAQMIVRNKVINILRIDDKEFISLTDLARYAEEADVLNFALFGMTAKEWRDSNPNLVEDGNIRDYADLLHLVILSNLENINAQLI